jgi:multidrug resistance protein
MSSNRSSIGIIFLTVLIDLIGFGIVIPVLPLYAQSYGATSLQIGLLVGVYSFAQFLFSPFIGKISDRVGRRPVLIVSVIGTAAGFFLMGWAQTLTLLFIARILDGISGGNISTAQAYIADITPPEERSKRMGLIGAAFGLGFMIGPAIGGVMSHISLAAPFYLAGGLAAVNALLIFFLLPESLAPEHRSDKKPPQPLMEVFRHGHGSVLATIMATYFFSITGFAMMTTLYALFNQQRFGLDARHTGYIFAFIGVIGVVIQGGMLRQLLKRFAEAQLATAGAAILTGALFLLPLCRSVGDLLWVSALIAVGNSFLTPTLNGLCSKHVDKSWQGRAMGLMQSAGSLGRTIGPVLAGWLLAFDLGGPLQHYARTPLWTGAVLLGVTFVLTLSLLKKAPPALEPAVAPAA